MALPTGLGPVTSSSANLRSIQLSYGSKMTDKDRAGYDWWISPPVLGWMVRITLQQRPVKSGTRGWNRTSGLPLRGRTLYPTELREQMVAWPRGRLGISPLLAARRPRALDFRP